VETYNKLKNNALDINQDLRAIIQKVASINGLSHDPLEAWQVTTSRVQRQLTEEVVRVAVVGSIKSGKSTLVNSLFGGDYVKRGAGVVTSIVTRIHPGDVMRARLEFKTWDEINAEINHALVLFSAGNSEIEAGSFDINRERDRVQLQQNLAALNAEQLISQNRVSTFLRERPLRGRRILSAKRPWRSI
jgi:septin family protein